MTTAAAEKMVLCRTTDGDMLDVELKLIRQSRSIDKLLKQMGMDQQCSRRIGIHVQVSTTVFKKVIEWLRAHDGIPNPVLKTNPKTGEIIWLTPTDFEKKFWDMEPAEFIPVVDAAQILDIPSMLDHGTQQFGEHIKSAIIEEEKHSPESRQVMKAKKAIVLGEIILKEKLRIEQIELLKTGIRELEKKLTDQKNLTVKQRKFFTSKLETLKAQIRELERQH